MTEKTQFKYCNEKNKQSFYKIHLSYLIYS